MYFAHESAIWAVFSRDDESLLPAVPGEAVEEGARDGSFTRLGSGAGLGCGPSQSHALGSLLPLHSCMGLLTAWWLCPKSEGFKRTRRTCIMFHELGRDLTQLKVVAGVLPGTGGRGTDLCCGAARLRKSMRH